MCKLPRRRVAGVVVVVLNRLCSIGLRQTRNFDLRFDDFALHFPCSRILNSLEPCVDVCVYVCCPWLYAISLFLFDIVLSLQLPTCPPSLVSFLSLCQSQVLVFFWNKQTCPV
jgi:hypothetical protein